MSEISERFRRLAAAFTAKVAAVPADRWESASPCEGWTARDVVRHLVDVQGIFLGLVGRELAPVPSMDHDPLAAWTAAAAQMQADLDDDAVASLTYEGLMGTMSLEAAVDRFVALDLVVHAWDLAQAAGLDDAIDPDEAIRGFEAVRGYGALLTSSKMFAAPIDAPDDADPQTKLLAALGRDPGARSEA